MDLHPQMPCGCKPSAKPCKHLCLSTIIVLALFSFTTNYLSTNFEAALETLDDTHWGSNRDENRPKLNFSFYKNLPNISCSNTLMSFVESIFDHF